MRLSRSSSLVLSSFMLLAAACSSSSSSGPGGRSGSAGTPATSVPESKVLSSITDTEARQLCKDYEAYMAQTITKAESQRFSCTFVGILTSAQADGDKVAACKTAFDACMSSPEEPDDSGEDSCAIDSTKIKNCTTVTVAEVSACIRDMASAFKRAAAEVSCEKPESLEAAGGERPASCKAVDEKCPALFDDDSDDSPSAAAN